jgi:hypothetical protein
MIHTLRCGRRNQKRNTSSDEVNDVRNGQVMELWAVRYKPSGKPLNMELYGCKSNERGPEEKEGACSARTTR